MPPPALLKVGFSPEDARTVVPQHGRGCERCNNTGYKGRVGLYEVMDVSDAIKELILVGASSQELRRKAQVAGLVAVAGFVLVFVGFAVR